MLIVDVETLAIPDVDTYLEPISAPSNYKDEAKIAAYVREERERQCEKAALDIDLAQIVAIGLDSIEWTTGPDVRLVDDEMTETDLLEWFWNAYAGERPPLVTFNGLNYDLPLLLRRSLYLGISAPQIQLDRFKHPHVIDVMQILSLDGRLKLHSLSFYANRFGLSTGEPDIQGKDIGKAWLAGDFAAVERHCRLDVEMTGKLAQRIGAIQAAVETSVA